MFYAAYGSNMNVAQMAQRCPKAVPVGVGYIRDYQLTFWRVATITRQPGRRVPVVLWEITDECEKALDKYEGYPSLYRKETLTVTSVRWMAGKNQTDEATMAMVYIMNRGEFAVPSKFYLEGIAEGYISFSINKRYLAEAIRRISS